MYFQSINKSTFFDLGRGAEDHAYKFRSGMSESCRASNNSIQMLFRWPTIGWYKDISMSCSEAYDCSALSSFDVQNRCEQVSEKQSSRLAEYPILPIYIQSNCCCRRYCYPVSNCQLSLNDKLLFEIYLWNSVCSSSSCCSRVYERRFQHCALHSENRRNFQTRSSL